MLENEKGTIRNDDERFDGDFTLMTGELAKMLADLVEALGGEAVMDAPGEQKVPEPREAVKGDEPVREQRSVKSLHDQVSDGLRAAGLTVVAHQSQLAEAPPGDGSASDPLYAQAVAVVRTNQRASISLVQRHLRIGYNRAARLLEAMEAAGLISAQAPDGSRQIVERTA